MIESKAPIRNIETEEIIDIERYEKAKKRRKKRDGNTQNS